MAYKNLVAFGAGEITPELAERSNLDKYQTGLKTLRNALVTKFGGLRQRAGFVVGDISMSNFETYYTPWYTVVNRQIMFQFLTTTVKIHTGYTGYGFTATVTVSVPGAYTYTTDQLKLMHFTNDDKYLYVFAKGQYVMRILLDSPYTIDNFIFYGPPVQVPSGPGAVTTNFYPEYVAYTAPSGYFVEYAYTSVKNDVETFVIGTRDINATTLDACRLPVGTNEGNDLYFRINTVAIAQDKIPDTIRFYRRPKNSGVWGFIGLGYPIETPAASFDWVYKATDFGQDADYTNQPPEMVKGFTSEGFMKPPTGLIYQNRLMIAAPLNLNKAFGSRTDVPGVFTRDFPLQDDSAVAMKTGSDGSASIGRFFDGRGLLISTNVGIYETPSDVLTFATAFAIKRSNLIHDEALPIIGMGGSTFVTDKRLNGVFKLTPNGQDFDLVATEVSIFSSHLFDNHKIVSWCIQDDGAKVLWCVREDGILLSFSFQEDQQLQAWARHDLPGFFKQVMILKRPNEGDILLAVVSQDGIDGGEIVLTLAKKNQTVEDTVATDYTYIFKNQLIKTPGEFITITNLDSVPPLFNGVMTYSNTAAGFFSNLANLGAVGTIYRFINPTTGENADYIVTAYVNSYTVNVQQISDRDFYLVMGVSGLSVTSYTMWKTFKTFQNLYALEGKKVSVKLDGFTHASPLNTDKDYNEYTVTGGTITLADNLYGHCVHIGLPMVADIQTLDPDSFESESVRIRSQISNKVYISYFKSRGVYIGSKYPDNDTVDGMVNHEDFFEPDDGIAAYIPPQPYSRREEAVIDGDWSESTTVAIRNVDPQPIGIRGILGDVEEIGVGNG